jgi:hypothetical protein
LIQVERLSQELRLILENTSTEVVITDQQNHLLAAHSTVPYTMDQVFDWRIGGSIDAHSNELSHWVPEGAYYNELVRWHHGYLIREKEFPELQLHMVMMTPFAPLLSSMVHTYQSQIWVLLFFCAAVLLLGYFYNRVFFLPLSKFSNAPQ